MSVKIITESSNKDILSLAIDNGDREKLDQALQKWGFKDYQSLLRFTTSVLLLIEDKSLWIEEEVGMKKIAPSDDLVNSENHYFCC